MNSGISKVRVGTNDIYWVWKGNMGFEVVIGYNYSQYLQQIDVIRYFLAQMFRFWPFIHLHNTMRDHGCIHTFFYLQQTNFFCKQPDR